MLSEQPESWGEATEEYALNILQGRTTAWFLANIVHAFNEIVARNNISLLISFECLLKLTSQLLNIIEVGIWNQVLLADAFFVEDVEILPILR